MAIPKPGEKLAYALGRNDELPNIELAVELAQAKDSAGIAEIVAGLKNPKEQFANDCIKVLYEIGERDASLVAKHVDVFLHLLASRNNRLVWGAMTALSKIAPLTAKEISESLELVVTAYKKGSVITVDNSISVFAEVAKAGSKYEAQVLPILLKHLETCRPKEVPQHSERVSVCFNKTNATAFNRVLTARIVNLTDSQKKRLEKVLKRLG